MSRKISLGVAIALALVLVAASIPLTMLYARNEQNRIIANLPQRAGQYAALEEIRDVADRYYLNEINPGSVNAEMVRGFIAGLGDAKSRYLSGEEYKLYVNKRNGESPDLGLIAVYEPFVGIMVSQVMPGSPAATSGLQKGDIIQRVEADGKVILNAPDVTQGNADQMLSELEKLRAIATERLSSVAITFQRDEKTETKTVLVGHNVPTVFSELMQEDVGYLRITAFYKNTADQLNSQIKDLTRQGATSLLLDLRDCAEGSLEYACQALDLFVPAGGQEPMALVNYRDREPKRYPSSAGAVTMPGGMAVLVNRLTDGAAELFAYDLRAFSGGKVQLVGAARTAGNNTVQEAFELKSVGGAVVLTVGTVIPYGGGADWCKDGVQVDLAVGNAQLQLSSALTLLKGSETNNEAQP
ncbi:MAG: PDZ domain-containing protein [Oscillospiraceae bacterium]|nr:PDZ domain-containing protein [Oscillospiraceae bacterium]